jgi:hypothetical protein
VWAAVCSPDGRELVRLEHAGREGAEELVQMMVGRLQREGAETILANRS